MYLEHFGLRELPFTLTPNTQFFCKLPSHQAALNVLLFSLKSGEGFIKIVGEIGSGKTLLCRMLLDKLGDDSIAAYIPNPDLTPLGLRKAIAQELGITLPSRIDQHGVLELLNQRLIELHQQGKRAVVIIDESQALQTPSLEAIRLLTNLETNTQKLLQVVLFGQPELDDRLNQTELRQLKQRISFSHHLKTLTKEETNAYVCHRLATAGYTLGSLFTEKACALLYKKSKGTPRLINVLCHKAMLVAYSRGDSKIDVKAMKLAIQDTESVATSKGSGFFASVLGGMLQWLGILRFNRS